MSPPLSETTIALVKASIPALEEHGVEIARRIYLLVAGFPERRIRLQACGNK